MLQAKEKLIFRYLMDHEKVFQTSKEIATALNFSDRTARTYLKYLMDLDKEQVGWEIIAKQGCGYQLAIYDRSCYQTFLRQEHLLDDGVPVSSIDDRHNYLLNKLLFEQEEVYFDDLAEELFVSRSTLSADLKKIRKILSPYGLLIESRPHKGIYIIGSERQKRRFIMDYFFDERFFKSFHNYMDINIFDQKIGLEEITRIVLDECREGHLKLSDFMIQNLVIHIALAVKRLAEGFQLAPIEELSSKDYPQERQVAEAIMKRVENVAKLTFPIEEIDYISLHLLSKSYNHGEMKKQEKRIREELLDILTHHEVISEYGFYKDFQLVEGLVTHLSTLYLRLQNHVHLDNPLREEIQSHYSAAFRMTQDVLKTMDIFSRVALSDDEIAYVALHFMAALERLKESHKINVLVICATGFGSAQMLKHRVTHELGHLVQVIDVIGYYDLNDKSLTGIDYIISSIDLSNLVFSVPVRTVSIFLNEDEIETVKQDLKIIQFSRAHSKNSIQLKNTDKKEIAFDDYFSPDCWFVTSNNNREQVMAELLERLSVGEELGFQTTMQELINQREQLSNIVFSDSIAVPHPIRPFGKYHRIAVAIIPEGLTWSKEYPAIRFIFLPSPSIYGNEELAQLTSKIVDLLDRVDLQEKMLKCTTFEEFKNLFLKI